MCTNQKNVNKLWIHRIWSNITDFIYFMYFNSKGSFTNVLFMSRIMNLNRGNRRLVQTLDNICSLSHPSFSLRLTSHPISLSFLSFHQLEVLAWASGPKFLLGRFERCCSERAGSRLWDRPTVCLGWDAIHNIQHILFTANFRWTTLEPVKIQWILEGSGSPSRFMEKSTGREEEREI